jgi:two-component system chemotaxis response regulator CheB
MHDTVVVGTSAGGVETLCAMVADLPTDCTASILVVLHLPARHTSLLSTIFDRVGSLPATTAVSGETLEPGRVYVCPPDHHMRVTGDTVTLDREPPEHGHRPSINVLFRSAAGPDTTGVLLSGVLDDGAAGLVAIADRGGRTIVQDRTDARYRDTPMAALAKVHADHVVPAAGIGRVLAGRERQARGRRPASRRGALATSETQGG